MAIAHEFDYVRPQSLNEALRLKDQYREQALVLAGGTDLVAHLREGQIQPKVLIDIKDIHQLYKLELGEGTLTVGAGVTFSTLISEPMVKDWYPILLDASRTVASVGIRNRATLVGNICSAIPSMDSAPALLCHEAEVWCHSVEGQRRVPIEQWFMGPRKTALRPNEIVSSITMNVLSHTYTGIYLKLGRYGGEDLAQAGWGIVMNDKHLYRIAHCALAPIPKRARQIEALLNGKELSDELIQQAMELVPEEITPITDIRSTSAYRLHISKVMLKRGLWAARERLNGKEVDARALLGGIK
jgi:carbon-monoxide dehydrogenase medium subunit